MLTPTWSPPSSRAIPAMPLPPGPPRRQRLANHPRLVRPPRHKPPQRPPVCRAAPGAPRPPPARAARPARPGPNAARRRACPARASRPTQPGKDELPSSSIRSTPRACLPTMSAGAPSPPAHSPPSASPKRSKARAARRSRHAHGVTGHPRPAGRGTRDTRGPLTADDACPPSHAPRGSLSVRTWELAETRAAGQAVPARADSGRSAIVCLCARLYVIDRCTAIINLEVVAGIWARRRRGCAPSLNEGRG